ncbi:MAG: M14 family metallopeptidase [Acidobacteriota bacterium]
METTKKITELVDDRVFYIIPTINPDGRDWFIHYPNTPNSSRSGKKPVDDDMDGLIDEDGYEDLDGDGNICQIRIKDPNGRWKPSSEDPRVMVRCKPDEKGTYTLLGLEGIDNDGDGRINEDGPGGYDLNRNWPFNWQPEYIQRGAHEYPFSLPETRAVGEFVLKHENIAAFQSYHNFGGMILQGPGQKDTPYAFQDAGIFEYIGKKGEEIIPGYRFVTVYKDMYTVWGGELDWFYLGRGVLGFSNELFTSENYFRKKTPPYQERRTRMFEPDKEPYDFNDLLLFGDTFVDWKPFKHPQFGEVEIGGFKKNFTRMPPSFLLEEECHRNAAFTLFYADCTPQVKIQNVEVKKIDGDLHNIWVTLENQRMIPTRTAQDVQNKISRADQVKIYGKDIKVLSAGFVVDKYTGVVTPVEKHPEYIEITSIPGMSTRIIQFTIKGKGNIKITIDSVKGGIDQAEIKI